MAICFWTGNGEASFQISTITIGGAPGAGDTVTVTMNGKKIVYTVVVADTTTTVATALAALLAASTAPPEFLEETWTSSTNTVIATAGTQGQPFTLSVSATGATTASAAITTANQSPNDIINAANWLRLGVQALPQNGDDVVISDSTVALLWNLNGLASVAFNSLTRWNTYTGQIGLPEYNANGYYEYRPTYFQFTSRSGQAVAVLLGLGSGSGPSLERYDGGNVAVTWQVQPTGSAIRILNSNAQSTFVVNGSTVDIATLPAETANCSGGATVVNGGVLNLGPGVTFNGTLTVDAASLGFCACNPTTITGNQAFISMNATAVVPGTVGTLLAQNGSQVQWNSNSTITQMQLRSGSTLDKSQDTQLVTATFSSMDYDCQVLDPWNAITWTNATVINGPLTNSIIQVGPGRSVKVA